MLSASGSATEEPPPECRLCNRPNCAGIRSHQPNNNYLGCRRCGLELNDLRSLFFRPTDRSPSTCEICGYRYRLAAYAGLHFLSHFNELSTASRPLFCVQCTDGAGNETEMPDCSAAKAAAAEADDSVGDDDDDDRLDMLKVEMLDYECELCGRASELYSTAEALDRHKSDVHGVEVVRKHDEGSSVSDAEAAEEQHLDVDSHDQQTDSDSVAVVPRRQFECAHCDQYFDSRNKLAYHRSKMHTVHPATSAPQQQSTSAQTLFECRLCDPAPTDDDDAAADDVSAGGHQMFGSRHELRVHEDAVHRNASTMRFPCAHCDRDYQCASFLALHLLKHTNRKRFACDLCGKPFGRLSHMQYHRSLHTTERAFECDICARPFKTAVSLRRHQVHMHPSGPATVRRYPCELCDKVFKDTSDRRRHRYTHGGFERKHACDLCEARFYEKKGLRAHRLTHERKAEARGKVVVKAVKGES